MTGDADPLECTVEGETERNSQIQAKAEHLLPIAHAAYDLLRNANVYLTVTADSEREAEIIKKKSDQFTAFFEVQVRKKIATTYPEELKRYYVEDCARRKQVDSFHSDMGTGFLSYEWRAKKSIGLLMQEWHAILDESISAIAPENGKLKLWQSNEHTYLLSIVTHFSPRISRFQRVGYYRTTCDRAVQPWGKNIDAFVDKAKDIVGTVVEPLKEKLNGILEKQRSAAQTEIHSFCEIAPPPDDLLSYSYIFINLKKWCENSEDHMKAHARTFLEDLNTVSTYIHT